VGSGLLAILNVVSLLYRVYDLPVFHPYSDAMDFVKIFVASPRPAEQPGRIYFAPATLHSDDLGKKQIICILAA